MVVEILMKDDAGTLVFDMCSGDMVAFTDLEDAINWLEPIDIEAGISLILDDHGRSYRPVMDVGQKKLLPIVLSTDDRRLLIEIMKRFALRGCPGSSVPDSLEEARKFTVAYLLPNS